MQLKLSLAKLDFAKFWIYKVYKEQFTIRVTRQKKLIGFFFLMCQNVGSGNTIYCKSLSALLFWTTKIKSFCVSFSLLL